VQKRKKWMFNMTERSIRFAVRGEGGRTSDVWKCWMNMSSGKRDVYLTSRPLGHALKLSLHERGQWHVGFHAEKKDDLFPQGAIPPNRFLGKWEHTEPIEKPVVLASRVMFPWSSPSPSDKKAPSDTVWIPAAQEPHAVEVLVFLVRSEAHFDEKFPSDMVLVGDLRFKDGGGVRILFRQVQMATPPGLSGQPKYFRGKSKVDLTEANRMVTWAQQGDGSILFLETRVELGDSPPPQPT